MELKKRIKKYLLEQERSICYLSRKTKVSRTTISLFLRDLREISKNIEIKLDKYLEKCNY